MQDSRQFGSRGLPRFPIRSPSALGIRVAVGDRLLLHSQQRWRAVEKVARSFRTRVRAREEIGHSVVMLQAHGLGSGHDSNRPPGACCHNPL